MTEDMYAHPRDDRGEFIFEHKGPIRENEDINPLPDTVARQTADVTALKDKVSRMEKTVHKLSEAVRQLGIHLRRIDTELDGKVNLRGRD